MWHKHGSFMWAGPAASTSREYWKGNNAIIIPSFCLLLAIVSALFSILLSKYVADLPVTEAGVVTTWKFYVVPILPTSNKSNWMPVSLACLQWFNLGRLGWLAEQFSIIQGAVPQKMVKLNPGLSQIESMFLSKNMQTWAYKILLYLYSEIQ